MLVNIKTSNTSVTCIKRDTGVQEGSHMPASTEHLVEGDELAEGIGSAELEAEGLGVPVHHDEIQVEMGDGTPPPQQPLTQCASTEAPDSAWTAAVERTARAVAEQANWAVQRAALREQRNDATKEGPIEPEATRGPKDQPVWADPRYQLGRAQF